MSGPCDQPPLLGFGVLLVCERKANSKTTNHLTIHPAPSPCLLLLLLTPSKAYELCPKYASDNQPTNRPSSFSFSFSSHRHRPISSATNMLQTTNRLSHFSSSSRFLSSLRQRPVLGLERVVSRGQGQWGGSDVILQELHLAAQVLQVLVDVVHLDARVLEGGTRCVCCRLQFPVLGLCYCHVWVRPKILVWIRQRPLALVLCCQRQKQNKTVSRINF